MCILWTCAELNGGLLQLYNDLTVNVFKIILLHEHRISVPLMPSIREGELPSATISVLFVLVVRPSEYYSTS